MIRYIVAALLLVHCAAPAPLSREVATALGPIRLGEVWDPAGLPEASRGDTVVGLPAGSVPGGGSVRVHRTPEGTVHRIWRDYPQSADFAGLVKDYRRRLGAPVSRERPADVEQRERSCGKTPRPESSWCATRGGARPRSTRC
ncbi:MAG: hypothetical protein H0V43_04875 [Gemmatimonadales bacterium]|nr:hypothetical protein [Gemmatimonadales bacterium]